MEINLSVDPGLVDQAVKVGGERTRKAAVTRALQEYIARHRQKDLSELMGKLDWEESFDVKVERSRE
ncbi:MAG TPA: type II toxin-antitoxin system VapB family antitoxin [Steroidobacteraceae bacterium]|nr:type II toxin-antitoxin system VapB family antitoxin [Steroidobacteraceae bacterium]